MKNKFLLAVFISFIALQVNGQVTVTGLADTVGCGTTGTTLTAHLIGDNPLPSGITIDDQYQATPLPLGFTFNFYGVNYTSCLVGPNGTICFDIALAGAYDDWQILAPLAGNPTVYNSICGPWCDVDVVFGGTITYSTDGVAPNRKFCANYCATHMYSCTTEYLTTQIICYETSNLVEVHLAHRTICASGWNGSHAIIGVQNASGSASTVAPGRDMTPNWTATDEAWRFTPTGGGTAYTVASIPYAPIPFASSAIYWYDSVTHAYLGTGLTLAVTPTVTTTYKVGALGCADSSFGYFRVVVLPCPIWAVSNMPCPGDSIKLWCHGDSVSATYAWSGPGGFTSTMQDPFIFPSTYADTGIFMVIRIKGGFRDTAYTHVYFHPKPTLTLTYNGPFCTVLTDTLHLTALPDSVGEVFSWTGPAGFTSMLENPTINGLTTADTGWYTVYCTTIYGCKDTAKIDVSMVSPPALTTDSPLVKTCVGVPVNLHVYPNPVFGSYVYAWNPVSFLSSTTIPNPIVNPTIAGDVTYTVTVGLASMPTCASTDTIHVHVVPNDFILANPDTVICIGQNVQTRVSGGSPEFTWAWTPPTGVSNTTITNPLITPPFTNTYQLTASYAHCPDMIHSFRITVDTPATPVTISDTICLGMSQNVNLSFPGFTFYHFLWTPVTYLSSDTMALVTITPTVIGDYTYTVTVSPGTNPAGCTINDIVKLHVAPNDFFLGNPDTIICKGQTVQTRVVGSTEFTYLWTPPTGVSVVNIQSPTITPTATTTYSVIASYIPHCPNMIHGFTITVDTPAIPVTIHDTICLGMTDNINLTFPGSDFYNFTWTPTTYLSTSTAPIVTINPLLVGDYPYNITVSPGTSPAGCTITDVVVLHVAPNDFILSNNDTAICLGKSVQAVVTGSSEFLYTWTPSAGVSVTYITDPILTPTVSTSYTITATYSPHCPDMMHHFYIEVDTLAIPVTIFDTTCLGTPDTINLTFAGSNVYHFQWGPTIINPYVSDTTSATPFLVPTVMGNYNWTVSVSPRALECSVTDAVNLLVVPNSFVISPVDTTICLGNSVQVRGVPYPLFSYQWIPTAGIPVSDIINPVITPDTSALYLVSAFYKKCPLMVDTLRLIVQPNPSVYIGGNRFMCEYDTIHITASVAPGWYNSYSYSWTPAASFYQANVQTVEFLDTLSQKVVVIVTTPNGCVGSDSAMVTVYPGNFLGPIGDYNLCPGDSVKITATGADHYYWRPVLFLSDSLGSSPTIYPITSNTYSVVGTSIHGCKDTTTFQVNVHPAAMIYLGDSATIYPGEYYALSADGNCTNFNWYPTYGLNNAGISNPVASPDMSMKYYVIGTTDWNCVATDSISIFVNPETLLALPNAFTPGNGVNTQFKIIKRGIASLNYFRIYNRWGEVIFETTDINKGWDGNYKGAPQPFDVYIYFIEAVTSTGKIFSKQGNITLIR